MYKVTKERGVLKDLALLLCTEYYDGKPNIHTS